ncbi:hypothetical protein PO124_24950 [Bacillus licheniformis]|nr:hypothetical protein [Bacillus licheniformis]
MTISVCMSVSGARRHRRRERQRQTTLLNIISGKETPDSGDVQLGSNLSAAYLTQHVGEMEEERTV